MGGAAASDWQGIDRRMRCAALLRFGRPFTPRSPAPCRGRPCSFECKSDGQYFQVLHASLEPASGDVPDSAYTGPVR